MIWIRDARTWVAGHEEMMGISVFKEGIVRL